MTYTKSNKGQNITKNFVTPESNCINRRTFIKELSIVGASTLSLFGSNAGAQNPLL